jgi:GTP cyclohydrolase I
MEDVQNRPDFREFPIDKVGVCDLRYPVVVLDRTREKQTTTATLSMSVDLPQEFKGTHMSRFLEVLSRHQDEMSVQTVPSLLKQLRERLHAASAHLEVAFPYFVHKTAPVSGASSLMDVQCQFIGEQSEDNEDFVMVVEVPVTSLCPCSKEISDYGAHNQRGYVTMEVRTISDNNAEQPVFWIEELVEIAEESASAPLYPLLKRSDERHVTMQAYDNPVFVEDLVRNVAVRLRDDERVAWFRVRTVNHESIHNHNAFAQIEWTRPS